MHTKNITTLPGPKFSREDLEILSSGTISSRFGDWFKPLDQYEKLIRMPEPPLLLADRILGIQGEPGKMGKGTIWTETDVRENGWYLHQNRMPAGIVIESGQADLLLISWLGLDFHNLGDRVYRLLGCELSYFGELPQPGETLCYDIHVDGHAQQGDVRLFFFHYDCHVNGELRLKVRHGQAGFFTESELAASSGVLWEPKNIKPFANARFDAPQVQCAYHSFSKQQIQDFADGHVFRCFGKGFEKTQTHTRTPRISHGNMLLIDEITHFDLTGGPLQHGYMRAVQHIHPDDWFFKGHFKNDPCMPGTLMLEAGLQVMSCYLTALGYTIDRDGWRFEPVPEQNYKLRCRGQVIPSSKLVEYEIYVTSIISGPVPMIFAELIGTADGLKAFHTNIGLRLIPDWPLNQRDPVLLNHVETKPSAVVNGFKLDYAALLAAAWGKPSHAFGNFYSAFDNHRRIPRLPGPPYHFISRVTHAGAKMGDLTPGGMIEYEYDIPKQAWYFEKNAYPTMPFCVLLEAALQPCGWLASYIGSVFLSPQDLLFRNLDGTGTLTAEILPTSGTLKTRVTFTNISKFADMVIETFKVECRLDDKLIYSLDTVFGFFPLAAFENQVGLPVREMEKEYLHKHSDFLKDLTQRSQVYFQGRCALPQEMLLMIDRVNGFWPDHGEKKLGILRAEKDVDPADWFFKAHFFQDPVQPGSLGIEAMIQLLQFYMLEKNMHQGIVDPHFEPLAAHIPMTWKYRGQVVPSNKIISLLMEITEIGSNEKGSYAIATSSLWVDHKKIYEAKNMGMRIVSGKEKNKDFIRYPVHKRQTLMG